MIVLEGTGAEVPFTKALDRVDAVSPVPSVRSAVPRPIATGLQSLHFGLNRSAKGCYVVARQCRLIY